MKKTALFLIVCVGLFYITTVHGQENNKIEKNDASVSDTTDQNADKADISKNENSLNIEAGVGANAAKSEL